MRSFGGFCDPLWSIYFDYKLVLFMVNLLFYFFNFCLSGTKYGYRRLQQNIRPFYTIKFFSNYFTWDLCVSVNWLSTYSHFAGLLVEQYLEDHAPLLLLVYSCKKNYQSGMPFGYYLQNVSCFANEQLQFVSPWKIIPSFPPKIKVIICGMDRLIVILS